MRRSGLPGSSGATSAGGSQTLSPTLARQLRYPLLIALIGLLLIAAITNTMAHVGGCQQLSPQYEAALVAPFPPAELPDVRARLQLRENTITTALERWEAHCQARWPWE